MLQVSAFSIQRFKTYRAVDEKTVTKYIEGWNKGL